GNRNTVGGTRDESDLNVYDVMVDIGNGHRRAIAIANDRPHLYIRQERDPPAIGRPADAVDVVSRAVEHSQIAAVDAGDYQPGVLEAGRLANEGNERPVGGDNRVVGIEETVNDFPSLAAIAVDEVKGSCGAVFLRRR